MRILFVSGVAVGGSASSTLELAERMGARGHAVATLFRVEKAPGRRYVHKRAVNLTVQLGGSALGRPVARAAGLIGRRPHRRHGSDRVEMWETILPENSLPALRTSFRPDVVVASSIGRMAWRQIRASLRQNETPSVLYLREENAFGHLTVSKAPPDLLIANARAHAMHAEELGYVAITIPSVITVDDCLVEGSGDRVLFVNPVPLYGVEVALAIAARRPDLQFVFAESWELTGEDWSALAGRVSELPNVELRRFSSDKRELYANARLLLAPYLFNGRPRVVLEAQANGIPILATDQPAVSEAVGPGGTVVDPAASVGQWLAALSELLDDPERYEQAAAAAVSHSRRDEVDPTRIVDGFEQALTELVARCSTRDRGGDPDASVL